MKQVRNARLRPKDSSTCEASARSPRLHQAKNFELWPCINLLRQFGNRVQFLTLIKKKLSIWRFCREHTLVRLIMTGNIVAGKNYGGYKYGGIAEKPPNLTHHYITCNIIFTKKNCKSTEFYLPYCKILYHSTV